MKFFFNGKIHAPLDRLCDITILTKEAYSTTIPSYINTSANPHLQLLLDEHLELKRRLDFQSSCTCGHNGDIPTVSTLKITENTTYTQSSVYHKTNNTQAPDWRADNKERESGLLNGLE
jgi:hypothetical protein